MTAAEHGDEPLAAMQRWMLDSLVFPGRTDGGEVERRFIASPTLDAAQCFAIYQRGYILRLTQCLAEQFPALCRALGRSLFDGFAREYLRAHPSDSTTLYELGRRFPAYLEEARPDHDRPPDARETWIDFMVDLARYERLHFRLFDAPGHEGRPWPTPELADDRLILQPCFALESYRYPVAQYYHAVREDPEAAFPPQQESHVAVLRRNYAVTTFPITRVHTTFLQHLQASGSVDAALAHVSEVLGKPREQVRRSWTDAVRTPWIEAGFFIDRDAEATAPE